MRILVVEDSIEYQQIISKIFGDKKIKQVSSAEEASAALAEEQFGLVLLDLTLPERDGYSLITEIQTNSNYSEAPIICLTGRKEITDKITAFSLGVEDYITKPFDPLELKARVEARLRKLFQKSNLAMITNIGDIEIDNARHRVTILKSSERIEVQLTQTEFKILCLLANKLEIVYSRDQILVSAWGDNARVLDRAVDSHICSLRKKLKSRTHHIKAVAGVGYKLTPIFRKK